MISFNAARFLNRDRTGFIISYEQIEEMTEEILKDYAPCVFQEPQAIECDDFLENYLKVKVDYQHIYTRPGGDKILGCSTFNRQTIPVFDEELRCKRDLECEPRTVILDRSLMDGNRKIQENITGLHEGGHIWLHSSLLTEIEGQLHMQTTNGVFCCRTSGVETGLDRDCKLSTESDWREWQATTFAVTLALPRESLRRIVPELFRKHGVDGAQLVVDADLGAKRLAEHTIPEALRDIYNMSKEAIFYRLKKLGFYITKKEYDANHAQLSLFD